MNRGNKGRKGGTDEEGVGWGSVAWALIEVGFVLV